MSQSIQIQVTQVGLEQSIAAAMKRVGSSSQINLGTSSKQINALSQPLGRITGQADEFSKSMAAANARVLAFGASAGIIAGVSKAMSGLVTSTIKVEKSLVEINSVLNKTGAELDKFGQDIFNVAKNTGKSFDEVASGALELARQGLNAEDTLARLNDALILSRLSGLDAAQSVEGLTAAFNSFQKSGITTAEILNKVVAVSQKYAVSERDIIEGVKRSASVAQQAGVSFEELAAVITAVQQTTARGGAVIGNSFKTIFARIQRKDVLSDLQNMGVAVTDLQGNVLPALRILENLAGKLNNFSQIEQSDIAEKLGGVFQLDKLLAALKDISSEASVTSGALEVMGKAGNSAYQKNAVLNQTLAALLNKVAVSAEQLGAKLGEIGVTDSLKNVLGFFNNLLEGIQRILGEESGLGNLVRGLAKGLGSFLAGPGLALFAGIILKLSKDLVQFGFASLKAFFGIGKAAKEVQNVEGAISQILAKNVNLQQQLFALEGNRAAQLRVITAALVEQEAVLRRSSKISSGLAAPLYNVGARATGSGLRIGNSADGYMPAVAKESKAIKQGVGGARSGDKPVVMPNFNFGGGKKGTMVAHTGEYVVPNFNGSGGSAVFNRQMVQSMGLPSGAKKINAAGGFVPNFAIKGLAAKDFDKEGGGEYKILAGRIFESLLRGENYIDLTENVVGPDIDKGKFKIKEAKISGKAAWRDSNFGTGKPKGSNLILPKTATDDFDKKLILEKGADIFRSQITHQKLFGIARKIIARESVKPVTNLSRIELASNGFIPNFAPKFNAETVRKYANEIEKYKLPTKDFYQFPDGTGGYGSQIKNVLSRQQSKAVANQQIKEKKIEDKGFFNLNADALGGILLVSPRFGKGQGSLDTSMQIGEIPFFNQDKSLTVDKNKYIKLAGIKTSNTPSGRDLKSLRADVNELFSDGIVKLAYRLYGETFDPASGGEFSSKLQSLDASRKQQLLPPAAQGDLFEAAGKVALNSFANLESLFGAGEQNRPFDFQNPEALRKVFGVSAKRGEAKRGGEKNFSSSKQVQGIIKKIFNDSEYGPSAVKSLRSQGAFNLSEAQKAAQAKNAFNGFIPNFAYKVANGEISDPKRPGNYLSFERGKGAFDIDSISAVSPREAARMYKVLVGEARRLGLNIQNISVAPQFRSKEKAAELKTYLPRIKTPKGQITKILETLFPELKYSSKSGAKNTRLEFLDTIKGFTDNSEMTIDSRNPLSALASNLSKRYNPQSVLEAIYTGDLGISSITDTAAGGYIPNFAEGPSSRGVKFTALQIAKGLGQAAIKLLIDQYLGDGVVDSVESAGLTKMKPSDFKFFKEELKKPAKGKHKKAFEKALLTDPAMQAAYPQYYRQILAEIEKYKRDNAAGGFLPNFANPLQAAVGREMAAGVPASQIYIDKSPALKNAANPMGLMVANRRDEPAGGFQGINRARREGANPMTYGAAGGFVPNYAAGGSGPDLTNFVGKTREEALAKELELYVDAMSALTAELDKAEKAYKKANKKNKPALEAQIKALEENKKTLDENSKATRKAIQEQTKGILGSGRTLTGGQARVPSPSAGGNRDMLGTIFAVQGAMTALAGATDGATSGFGFFANTLGDAASTASTVAFGFSGIGQMLPQFSKQLGVAGLAIGAVTLAYKIGTAYYNKMSGITSAVASSVEMMGKAAEGAAISLNTIGAARKEEIQKRAKTVSAESLLYGEAVATATTNLGSSSFGSYNTMAPSYTFMKRSATFEGEFGGVLNRELRDQYNKVFESALAQQVPENVLKEAADKIKNDGLITAGEIKSFSAEIADAMEKASKEVNNFLNSIKDNPVISNNLAKMKNEDFAKLLDTNLIQGTDDRAKAAGYNTFDEYKAADYKVKEGFDLKGRVMQQLGMTPEEYDRRFSGMTEAQVGDVLTGARTRSKATLTEKEEAVAQSPIQLKKAIQAAQREKLEREAIRGIDQQIAEQRNTSAIKLAGIETDLTLSASERTIKTLETQAVLEKQTAELERQKTIQQKINELSAGIKDNPVLNENPENIKIVQELLNKLKDSTEAQALLTLDKGANQYEAANQLITDKLKTVSGGEALSKLGGAVPQLATLLIDLATAVDSSKQSVEDEEAARQKNVSVQKAQTTIQEQNSRLLREAQNNISAIADNYTMQASRVAGQLRLNPAQQELALARYNATTQETDPKKLREGERRILDEFFQKQVALQAKQSQIEAKAEFMRNLKVEENIIQLNDNTKATIENTNAIINSNRPATLATNTATPFPIDFNDSLVQEAMVSIRSSDLFKDVNDQVNNCAKVILKFAKAMGIPTAGANDLANSFQNVGTEIDKSELKAGDFLVKTRGGGPNDPKGHVGMYLGDGRVLHASQSAGSGNGKQAAAITNYDPQYWDMARRPGVTVQQATAITAGIGEKGYDKAVELSKLTDAQAINAEALKYAKTLNISGDAATGLAEQIKNVAIRMREIGVEKALAEEEQRLKNMTADAQALQERLALSDARSIKGAMERPESTFTEGMRNGFLQLEADTQDFAYLIGKDIPKMFADGMSNAITSAIDGTKDLDDALRSAALDFVKTINQRAISNLMNNVFGSIGGGLFSEPVKAATGGMIKGGSGSKDDIPAMLMGGEYVVNKKAVSKYGPQFLEAINNGTLSGYAKGGKVTNQTGPQGNFYTPGTFGQGSIEGKRNLLDFATQTGTSGKFDQIVNESGFQAINLEAESANLSVSGMRNSPLFDATQAAKGQAFDLYLQQYNQEQEIAKQKKEQKKELQRQLIVMAGTAVAGGLLQAGVSGFKAGFKGAAGKGFGAQLGAGFKGIWSGGNVGGGMGNVGGLKNLFGSAGKAFSGDFAGAAGQYKMSQISSYSQLENLYKNNTGFQSFIDSKGGLGPGKALAVPQPTAFGRGIKTIGNTWNSWMGKRATGGIIPSTSGIDTVPAMLSGGEFVMNRSAVQSIGAPNLQSMNSGGTSITSEDVSKELNEKLLSKLDELIKASESNSGGNITINVDSSGKSTQQEDGASSEQRQELARRIKEVVLQVINDEKRIGGSLRR